MPIHHIGTSHGDTVLSPNIEAFHPIVTAVLLKFKQGITPADVEKIRKSLHALPSQIPAIRDVKVGTKIKHPFDHDFDEGVIFVFDDEDALKNDYSPHKAHRDYQEFTAPYVQGRLCTLPALASG
ncbi:hypothetical protein J3R83DRAFT_12781 [Lanmaoa asiatica]|nr:hypothetical protein J3R83DRAFT_12781 [Lanmaoa asiatica]